MSRIAFNIATVDRRRGSFLRVLRSLANQTMKCDVINVAMTYPKVDVGVEQFLKDKFKSHTIKYGTFCASEKMFTFDEEHEDSFFLTFDDDIIYPPDYCEKTITVINSFDKKNVIGWHGIHFNNFPVKNYYDRKIYQYFAEVKESQQVHVIGTGCCGFYVKTLRDKGFTFKIFDNEFGNYNDMIFAQWNRDNGVEMRVIAHPRGWITICPGSQDQDALWVKSKAQGKYIELKFLQT